MLLTIAGVISALAVMNAVYPAVTRSASALVSASGAVDDRIKTNIEVVHAAKDPGGNNFLIWVKNVGNSRIVTINESDVFFGQPGNIAWVPHVDDAGGTFPRWSYTIENGTEWGESVTVRITVFLSAAPPTGTWYIKVVTPNGVSTEHYFSI